MKAKALYDILEEEVEDPKVTGEFISGVVNEAKSDDGVDFYSLGSKVSEALLSVADSDLEGGIPKVVDILRVVDRALASSRYAKKWSLFKGLTSSTALADPVSAFFLGFLGK